MSHNYKGNNNCLKLIEKYKIKKFENTLDKPLKKFLSYFQGALIQTKLKKSISNIFICTSYVPI